MSSASQTSLGMIAYNIYASIVHTEITHLGYALPHAIFLKYKNVSNLYRYGCKAPSLTTFRLPYLVLGFLSSNTKNFNNFGIYDFNCYAVAFLFAPYTAIIYLTTGAHGSQSSFRAFYIFIQKPYNYSILNRYGVLGLGLDWFLK